MSLEEVKKIIVGTWIPDNDDLMGGYFERYTFSEDTFMHKNIDGKIRNKSKYTITEEEGKILLNLEQELSIIYATSETTIVLKGNTVRGMWRRIS